MTLLRTPQGAIQPQAAVDARGVLHLVYFAGDPAHGDIFYVHKKLDQAGPFSPPIRVNSHPGSAVALGTIRGAQIAIGKDNRVHVVWNGSDQAPKGPGGAPMLYTRLNETGTAFEPERNLITWAGGIDGGGSVAADTRGDVYVTWHATPPGKDESGGAVYVARSTDNGKTFAREHQASTQPTGACGCCSMRAFVDSHGALYILYRAAAQGVHRDTTLLVSRDHGARFRAATLQKWDVDVCPMSSFSLAEGRAGTLGGWETRGQVYYAALGSTAGTPPIPVPAPGTGSRKYPVVVPNTQGQVLLAWVEGAGWARGGALAWQVYDRAGRPTEEHGRADGVPMWSLVSAFARPDGGFVIVY